MEAKNTVGVKVDNLRIADIEEVCSYPEMLAEFPITPMLAKRVKDARREIHNILHNQDDRLVVIVGPCSIHDPGAAIDYAERLKALRDELADDLHIVMRVYFEKPRTTVGWKGLINDPDLDGSFDINKGLRLARKLLLDITELGLPAASEFLDLMTPQYITDLISWGAIGARTTESQIHREMASGLSCPVGFKNATNGSIQVAVDALISAKHKHRLISLTGSGATGIFTTTGNDDAHIILRGGKGCTNYSSEDIQTTARALEAARLNPAVMVDCSHGNSEKKHKNQIKVAIELARQIACGEQKIVGVMLESNLKEGRQDYIEGKPLTYGQSITDACIDWADTEYTLRALAQAVRERRATISDLDGVAA